MNMTRLKEIFIKLTNSYCLDDVKVSALWQEIVDTYHSSDRYYHNISHLNSMLTELESVKNLIEDWNSILFSLFYHDFIYDVTRLDNEEKSVSIAAQKLSLIGVPAETIDKVSRTILATKSHSKSDENDINFFIDTDISIFWKENVIHKQYFKNVRLEYLIYPSYLFNEGRIKVLQHFLEQSRIYKTNFFLDKYELTARTNIESEIKELKRMNNSFVQQNSHEFIKYLEEDGDLSEFFYNASKLLDRLENIEKITFYPGWFDSGYYRFKYCGTTLHLEYEGMLGTYLKTEPNANDKDIQNAKEIFQKLLEVRLTEDDLIRLRKFYQNTAKSN